MSTNANGLPPTQLPSVSPIARAGSRDGFVLLELVLAMAILALLASLALPRANVFDGTAHLGLKAQEIAVLLRRDRDAALSSRQAVRTEIDLARNAIRSGAANGEVSVPLTVALRYEAREPAIRFASDGSASRGTIVLAGRQAGNLVAVEVDGLTGAVTVVRESGHAPRP